MEFFGEYTSLMRTKFSEKPIFLIMDETQKKGKKYLCIFCGAVKGPLERYIIYLKVGVFKCASNQMITLINEALNIVNSDISFLHL